MGRIDPISAALESEYGMNLSTGKFIPVSGDIIEAEEFRAIDSDLGETESGVDCHVEDDSEYDADEEYVKGNIKKLIEDGMDLVEDMTEYVRISESPRSFEPAAAYLKTLVELNEKLLDIHDRNKKRKSGGKDKKENATSGNNYTQNNIIATATPSEILKMIKGK